MNHTARPWKIGRVQAVASIGIPVLAPDGSAVAVVLGSESDECKANANLIVAAPELFNALYDLLSEFTTHHLSNCTEFKAFRQARAAIDKAEGKT